MNRMSIFIVEYFEQVIFTFMLEGIRFDYLEKIEDGYLPFVKVFGDLKFAF